MVVNKKSNGNIQQNNIRQFKQDGFDRFGKVQKGILIKSRKKETDMKALFSGKKETDGFQTYGSILKGHHRYWAPGKAGLKALPFHLKLLTG